MTLVVERKLAACLQGVRPRAGFASELFHQLTADPVYIYPLDPVSDRTRSRWLVAGAVAGVVSATGAVYLATRRHHQRGAA